jgi:nitrous oxide reductase accessory protein NosL
MENGNLLQGYQLRIVLMTILLAGCGSFSDTELSPRQWECNAICEGCERCIVDCNVTGQGEEIRELKVDQPNR